MNGTVLAIEERRGRKPFHYGEQKGDKREATWAVKFIPIGGAGGRVVEQDLL